jgi:hypothetical protein
MLAAVSTLVGGEHAPEDRLGLGISAVFSA